MLCDNEFFKHSGFYNLANSCGGCNTLRLWLEDGVKNSRNFGLHLGVLQPPFIIFLGNRNGSELLVELPILVCSIFRFLHLIIRCWI